jgi:hypothetical protein
VESLNLSGLFIYFMSDSPYVFFNGGLHSIAYSYNHEFICALMLMMRDFVG